MRRSCQRSRRRGRRSRRAWTWRAPAWPREHGGMGLAPEKLLIFIEEQERCALQERAGNGNALALPARQAESAVSDKRVQPIRQLGDEGGAVS